MDFGKQLVSYAMVRNEENLGSFSFSTLRVLQDLRSNRKIVVLELWHSLVSSEMII